MSDSSKANLPASHAILLGLVITTTLSVVAVGSDVVLEEQGDLSRMTTAGEFEDWHTKTATASDIGEPREAALTFSSGTHIAENGGTRITIENQTSGNTVVIETARLTYSPRGSENKVIYESGLISEQYRRNGTHVLSKSPDQTYYNSNSGSDLYLLRLMEHDLSYTNSYSTIYSRNYNYIVYPNKTESIRNTYRSSDTVDITVETSNYQAWESFFADHPAFTTPSTTPNTETVTTSIEPNLRFRLQVDSMEMIHPVRVTSR